MIAAVLACAALSADAVAQQTGRRVGVVISLQVNVTPAEAQDLSTALGAALQGALPVETIAGRETARRLPAQGLPESCVAEAPCRLELGRRLDADELLFLVVVRLDRQIQIDVTWADVASGRVGSRPAITVEAGDELAAVFTRAAPLLLPHMARSQPEPAAPSIIVVPAQDAGGRRVTAGTWVAGGISAASLVGGAVFALSANIKYSSLESQSCRMEMCNTGDIDRLRTHARAADALMGLALASGVTAAILYWTSGASPPAPDSTVRPAIEVDVASRSAAVSLGGRF